MAELRVAPRLAPRAPAASVEDLLAGAEGREPLAPADGKSQVRMERVRIGGVPHVVKHVHLDDDWIMRATGDLAVRPLRVWTSGLLDALPDCLDPCVVGAAPAADGRGAAILMRDVGPWLVPEGDGGIPLAQHRRFLAHMARLHAAFWEWEDTVGLATTATRYLMFHPSMPAAERARGGTAAVPPIVAAGWERFFDRGGPAAALVAALHADPDPLLRPLAATPQTLVHGDWKAGNLGTLPGGRTVLLDWAFPGRGAVAEDVAWYVCLNRERLPESKEATLAASRAALEAEGVATGGWWDEQVAWCLLGALVQFGWEKALGDETELAWWEHRACRAARLLS